MKASKWSFFCIEGRDGHEVYFVGYLKAARRWETEVRKGVKLANESVDFEDDVARWFLLEDYLSEQGFYRVDCFPNVPTIKLLPVVLKAKLEMQFRRKE